MASRRVASLLLRRTQPSLISQTSQLSRSYRHLPRSARMSTIATFKVPKVANEPNVSRSRMHRQRVNVNIQDSITTQRGQHSEKVSQRRYKPFKREGHSRYLSSSAGRRSRPLRQEHNSTQPTTRLQSRRILRLAHKTSTMPSTQHLPPSRSGSLSPSLTGPPSS